MIDLAALESEFESADIQGRIDLAARVRGLFKRVETLDKFMSDSLKQSTVLEIGRFVAGASFEAKLSLNERFVIDQKTLRENAPDIAAEYGRTIQYESITYRAR
jgi:hypothetical protein